MSLAHGEADTVQWRWMAVPESYKCSCQVCGEHVEYPPSYEGQQVACPHCGQGTLLQQPRIQASPTPSAIPAAPPMGGMPPPSAAASPAASPAAQPEVDEGPDPYLCENCGADMIPEDKVCVECGHRRAAVKKWTGTAVFRLVAGLILLGELVVLGLQWTTEGEPFGLRQRTRHAVLVKVGLREELDPAAAAKSAGTNAPAALATVPKDPDLKLEDHSIKPDKDNGALYIHGVVKNISQFRYLAVRVNFQLKDSAGSPIPDAVATAYSQSIEPGKEWSFKALILDPDAVGYEPLMPIEGYR